MGKEYEDMMTESSEFIIHICALENEEGSGRHHMVFSCGHVFVKHF